MNNAVYEMGRIVGYRCFNCGSVCQSMWGETCNECRTKADENKKLLNEVIALRNEITKITEAVVLLNR